MASLKKKGFLKKKFFLAWFFGPFGFSLQRALPFSITLLKTHHRDKDTMRHQNKEKSRLNWDFSGYLIEIWTRQILVLAFWWLWIQSSPFKLNQWLWKFGSTWGVQQRQIDCRGLAAPSPITRLNYIFAALLAGGGRVSTIKQQINTTINQSIVLVYG